MKDFKKLLEFLANQFDTKVSFHKEDEYGMEFYFGDYRFFLEEAPVEKKVLNGVKEVKGWALEIAVPYPGNRNEPPGVDDVELIASDSKPEIVMKVAATYANELAKIAIENWAYDLPEPEMEEL